MKLILKFILMYECFPEFISVYVYNWYPQKPEGNIGPSEIGITDNCEPLCGS